MRLQHRLHNAFIIITGFITIYITVAAATALLMMWRVNAKIACLTLCLFTLVEIYPCPLDCHSHTYQAKTIVYYLYYYL